MTRMLEQQREELQRLGCAVKKTPQGYLVRHHTGAPLRWKRGFTKIEEDRCQPTEDEAIAFASAVVYEREHDMNGFGFRTVETSPGTWQVVVHSEESGDLAANRNIDGFPITSTYSNKVDAQQRFIEEDLSARRYRLYRLDLELRTVGARLVRTNRGWKLESDKSTSPPAQTMDELQKLAEPFLEQESRRVKVKRVCESGVTQELLGVTIDDLDCAADVRRVLQDVVIDPLSGWLLVFGSATACQLAAAVVASAIGAEKKAVYRSLWAAVRFQSDNPGTFPIRGHNGVGDLGDQDILVFDASELLPPVKSATEGQFAEMLSLVLQPKVGEILRLRSHRSPTILVAPCDPQQLASLIGPQVLRWILGHRQVCIRVEQDARSARVMGANL